MKYRRVGSCDLEISEVAFGCGGNAGLMIKGSPAEQTRIVARALELGITYFDNSPDYGDGVAETNLGRVMKELKHRPLLNSKVEIRAADLNDISNHVVRSCEESLKRLGVDYVDMFQIHNGPTAKPLEMKGAFYAQLGTQYYPAAIDGIRRLLGSGKIRYAGFICRGNDATEVRDVLDSGLFHLINIPYTLLNPTAGMKKPDGLTVDKDFGDEIGLARARGASAAIYSPLASGVLTDDFLAGIRHPLAKPLDKQPTDRIETLKFLKEATGASLAQAAIRFVLMNPGVATVLGGFSAMEQLEETAKVPDLPPLSPDVMKRLDALWRADFRSN